MDRQALTVTNNILTVDGSLYLDHLLKDASGPRFILRLKAEGGGHGRAGESFINFHRERERERDAGMY